MGVFDIDSNIRKIKFKDRFSMVNYSITSRLSSLDIFIKGNDIFHLDYLCTTPELLKLSINFTKYIFSNEFYFDPEQDLSTQLKSIIEKFINYDIVIDDKTISFNNKLHQYLACAYEQYLIRTNFGMEKFEHPENVAYIHIIIDNNIHWFYPINCQPSH